MNKPALLLSWMDALGDETRLRLLHLLEAHELGVVELCDVLQMPQSTVSRHLKVLAEHRFLTSRRVGTNHLYRLIEAELSEPQRRLLTLAREQSRDWAALKQDELRLARRLAERQSSANAFFAGAAAEWDRLRAEYYGSRFHLEAMLALLPPQTVVADLGCGTGATLVQLAPHVAKVIGVDSSPAMLSAAMGRLSDLANVELLQGDLRELPIADAACDAALLVLALSYVPSPAKVVAEMTRILRPGGRAVLVDLLPHDRDDFRRQMEQSAMGFSEPDVSALFASAGLSRRSFRPLPPEPTVKGPALFLATGTKPQ
jgi:ArsR family transcriptional regulator